MGVGRTSVAKITRPSSTDCYTRKRLFQAVDRGLKQPILWISGPPGSGKTTLVSSYVAARKLPCIWYQVDPRDGDVATCFYYLGLAARKAAPRIRKTLPVLTPEYLPDLPAFTRRFFESLFSRIRYPGVIVFDDCHGVPADSSFHGVVQEGLSLLPEGNRAILISRGPPPAVFSRYLANRKMGEFPSEALRFTLEETRQMVRRSGYASLARDAVRDLHEKTGGWAAGIAVLMREYHPGEVSINPRSRRAPLEIFDYFASEAFGKETPEVRDFLMRSAFLPRMTREMAERVTGHSRAEPILSYLHRHNCFTEILPDGGNVYRYHQLFRGFLLARAKEDLAGPEIQRLQRTTAAVLAESGYWEDAVEPMQESRDWDGLASIVLSQAPSLVAQGRFRTLEDWIRKLPDGVLKDVPWLLYWCGVSRLPFDPEESGRCFEDAFRKFRTVSDSAGAFLAWSGVVDSIFYTQHDLARLDPWIDLIDDLVKEYGGLPPGLIKERVTGSMIKAIAFRRPQHADRAAWEERCDSVARTSSDLAVKVDSLVALALYQIYAGEHRRAGLVIDAMRDLVKGREVSPLTLLTAMHTETIHSCIVSDYERCPKLMTKGLELARLHGVHLFDFNLRVYGALAYLHLGDTSAGRRILGELAACLHTARSWESCFYHYIASWEALGRGDTGQALFHVKTSMEGATGWGNFFAQAQNLILGAHISYEQGDRKKAVELLADSRRIGTEMRSDFILYDTLLTEAFHALRSGDEGAAAVPLREGMRIGNKNGYSSVLFWRPGFLEAICARALEEGVEVEFARELIRRNRLLPDPAAVDLEGWPWPVKVYTLGRFDLVVEGKSLPFARKVRQKPLQLLKALIALGGRDVPEEQVSELLWPDADGDLAHQSLATTLKRLRKQLGDDRAVLLRDGRLTLNNRHCWVDAWAFERILGQAVAAPKPGAPVRRGDGNTRIVERAIALYRGAFLSGETFCSDIVTYRERLRSRFLRAVVQAGRHWEHAGEWGKALESYQRGLDVDALSEDMCRGLIVCNMRMGRAAEAHAVYRRCCKTLSEVLGVGPSPELKAILASAQSVPVLVEQ